MVMGMLHLHSVLEVIFFTLLIGMIYLNWKKRERSLGDQPLRRMRFAILPYLIWTFCIGLFALGIYVYFPHGSFPHEVVDILDVIILETFLALLGLTLLLFIAKLFYVYIYLNVPQLGKEKGWKMDI